MFSRATTESAYMCAADYEKVAAVLEYAIPDGVSTAHWASLKSKIKYGNELAFYKRVLQLVESLSKPAQEIVCKDPVEFARNRRHQKLLHAFHRRAAAKGAKRRSGVSGR